MVVNVKDHAYGLTCPASERKTGWTKMYWQLTDGKQVDFLDGEKKGSNAAAKCDLAGYSGTATVTLYKTDTQVKGTYPTGLVKVKEQTVQIQNGD